MGLSFITEGAIPFAAKKPKVIIPSIMLAGAIGSMLVAAFQITLPAPHGGIFVFPLIKSEIFTSIGMQIGMGITLYIFSILVGSLVGAFNIYILTKYYNKKEGVTLEEVEPRKISLSIKGKKKYSDKKHLVKNKKISKTKRKNE